MTLKPKKANASEFGQRPGGPVAWWNLDETAGASVADASGHHLEGRLQGQSRWAPTQGRCGGALELDGANSYVDCGQPDAFDFSDALTISMWFKVRQFDKPSQVLAAKGNDTWRLERHDNAGTIEFIVTGPETTGMNRSKTPVAISKRTVDDGRWHHVAGLYDGKRVALYLDGQLEHSVDASGSIAQNTEPVLLGENSGSRGRSFNGWLDDVRLYGHALTADEIRALYSNAATALGTGERP
jgi:beta-galactosidase